VIGGKQTAKAVGSLGDYSVRTPNLSRSVPKDVKLAAGWRSVEGLLESGAAIRHNLPGDSQRVGPMAPICLDRRISFPEFRADLIPGNLPGSAYRAVISSRFEFGQGCPQIASGCCVGRPNYPD
jgi:hypothetical protein